MSIINQTSLGVTATYTNPQKNKKFALEYFELINLTEIWEKFELEGVPTIEAFKEWQKEHKYFTGPQGSLLPTQPGRYTLMYENYSKFFDEYLTTKFSSILEEDTIISRFNDIKLKKQKFWYDLKKDYGQYLVEGYYENTIESDSLNLYRQALLISREHFAPQENYSLSYLNSSDLVNININPIFVGDFIKIRGEDLGILNSASNELQVVAISEILREENNISLTVNKIRRNDILVQKLLLGLVNK
jgi:hypothetical protein